MKRKATKTHKRTSGAPAPQRSANARGARAARGEDLGDRRLQLLLGTKGPSR
jgi:hypothetical protein